MDLYAEKGNIWKIRIHFIVKFSRIYLHPRLYKTEGCPYFFCNKSKGRVSSALHLIYLDLLIGADSVPYKMSALFLFCNLVLLLGKDR